MKKSVHFFKRSENDQLQPYWVNFFETKIYWPKVSDEQVLFMRTLKIFKHILLQTNRQEYAIKVTLRTGFWENTNCFRFFATDIWKAKMPNIAQTFYLLPCWNSFRSLRIGLIAAIRFSIPSVVTSDYAM